MALDGIIFDLDGTLLDTNHLHARAWAMAFEQFGFILGEDRIALEIGKGGSMLVPALVGKEAEREQGDALRDAHGELYRKLIKEGVRVFPRVEELFRACRERGLRIAVATASKQENLEEVLEAAGLDLQALADDIVTDSDVERSKPHADVVVAAYQKLGLGPGQCVMVGDTPYDGQAAVGGGVTCIGLMTGAHDEAAMRSSGIRVLHKDTGDLLDHLDEALDAASPGAGRLTPEFLEEMMDEAIEEAGANLKDGGYAGGALLARSDGTVVARARSASVSEGRPLAHAVLQLLSMASVEELAHEDLVLFSTDEPCSMCFGAALEARIDTIVFANEASDDSGGFGRCAPLSTEGARFPRVIRGVRSERVDELMAEWREQHQSSADTSS